MKLKEYVDKMYPVFGGEKNKLTRELFKHIVDYENNLDAANAIDERDDSAFGSYYRGQNGLKQLSKIIVQHINIDHFAEYLKSLSESQMRTLFDNFKNELSDISDDDKKRKEIAYVFCQIISDSLNVKKATNGNGKKFSAKYVDDLIQNCEALKQTCESLKTSLDEMTKKQEKTQKENERLNKLHESAKITFEVIEKLQAIKNDAMNSLFHFREDRICVNCMCISFAILTVMLRYLGQWNNLEVIVALAIDAIINYLLYIQYVRNLKLIVEYFENERKMICESLPQLNIEDNNTEDVEAPVELTESLEQDIITD